MREVEIVYVTVGRYKGEEEVGLSEYEGEDTIYGGRGCGTLWKGCYNNRVRGLFHRVKGGLI